MGIENGTGDFKYFLSKERWTSQEFSLAMPKLNIRKEEEIIKSVKELQDYQQNYSVEEEEN